MDFIGTGLRMTAEGIAASAKVIGCDVARMRAVIAVESNGRGFDSQKRPTILFEPHVFYRNLSGAPRALAVRRGLAYAAQGIRSYPKSSEERYRQLAQAMAIDETAALKSASWGLGQILGENFNDAGFSSPQQMVESFCQGEDAQVMAMARFIVKRGLAKPLIEGRFAAFARGYNGPKFKKFRYDEKLAAADARLRKSGTVTSAAPTDDEERICFVQERLKALGYFEVGEIDGRWGTRTRGALLAFKADHDLPRTDEIDEKTILALSTGKHREVAPERETASRDEIAKKSATAERARKGKIASFATALWSGAMAAAAGVSEFFSDASEKIAPVKDMLSDVPGWFWLACAAAIAFVLYRSHKDVEDRVVEDYRTGKKP